MLSRLRENAAKAKREIPKSGKSALLTSTTTEIERLRRKSAAAKLHRSVWLRW